MPNQENKPGVGDAQRLQAIEAIAHGHNPQTGKPSEFSTLGYGDETALDLMLSVIAQSGKEKTVQ